MRYLLALLLLIPVLGFRTASAQTDGLRKAELWEMADLADLVVHVRVTQVKGTSFTADVLTRITGDPGASSITVKKFISLNNAKRWGKYAVNEEVLLFLKKDGEGWTIMGDGGEGEKLILNGEVYLDSRGGGLFNKFNYVQLGGGIQFYAEKVGKDVLFAALKDYPDFFTVTLVDVPNPATGIPVVTPMGALAKTEKELDEFRARSEVHDRLATLSIK